MSTPEHLLRSFAADSTPQKVTEVVANRVFHVMGYGHSNATFVIADDTVVVIDTLDSLGRGQALLDLIRERTDKPIGTIIYTHSHPDHRGGAAALIGDDPEIIQFAPIRPPLPRSVQVQGVLGRRGVRQFGYRLSDDEVITQGLGPREGHTHGDPYGFVPATTVIGSGHLDLTVGGVELQVRAAPGETDDTIFVWFPQYNVVCSADNYYACWPNLYPIRGGQYRDVATWIESLDAIIALDAVAVLPGHHHPLLGKDVVHDRLTAYRDALDWVLNETLRLVNEGVGIDEIGHCIALPDHLRDLPFLREHYGTLEWSAKAIMTGYVGWFDGNPTNLHPLAPADRSRRMIAAMGGTDRVAELIVAALSGGDDQWAMELCDSLIASGLLIDDARTWKARAMRGAAQGEISACGRNYYLASAQEIEHSSQSQ